MCCVIIPLVVLSLLVALTFVVGTLVLVPTTRFTKFRISICKNKYIVQANNIGRIWQTITVGDPDLAKPLMFDTYEAAEAYIESKGYGRMEPVARKNYEIGSIDTLALSAEFNTGSMSVPQISQGIKQYAHVRRT